MTVSTSAAPRTRTTLEERSRGLPETRCGYEGTQLGCLYAPLVAQVQRQRLDSFTAISGQNAYMDRTACILENSPAEEPSRYRLLQHALPSRSPASSPLGTAGLTVMGFEIDEEFGFQASACEPNPDSDAFSGEVDTSAILRHLDLVAQAHNCLSPTVAKPLVRLICTIFRRACSSLLSHDLSRSLFDDLEFLPGVEPHDRPATLPSRSEESYPNDFDHCPENREHDRIRVPRHAVKVRQTYSAESPEWNPIAFDVKLAVERFYELGDAHPDCTE